MESNQGIKAWQWVVTAIVVIVLVVLGYYMIKGGNGNSSINDNATTTEETANENSNDINRVMISDQYPGNIAYVSSVQLSNPGFVVIQEDKDGVPGNVIGSKYFEEGINTGKVMLTKNTVEGKVYYAVLYKDDGDKLFDIEKDTLLKGLTGANIMKSFKATSNITEIKG
jgi:hypothetical protein